MQAQLKIIGSYIQQMKINFKPMKNLIPYRVKPINEKFYKTTQFAYYFGLTHLSGYFGFQWLGIPEMAWFNVLISSPSFIAALILNRLGKHNLAFGIAFFELFFHQVLGTYFMGWGVGFQFLLIYLAGLSFFNPRWKKSIQIVILLLISSAFVLLYLFCQTGVYQIPDEVTRLFFVNGGVGLIFILAILINGYSKAAHKAEDELKLANAELSEMNEEIRTQNEQIVNSINYAEKIQHALLPSDRVLKENFSDFFLMFQPKDIVSGDFYWFSDLTDKIVLICADSTGHGVPGGFMSMLGMSYIDEIVHNNHITEPEVILEQMRIKIKKALDQNIRDRNPKDGMDMSVCVFEKDFSSMKFAGANNGIFLIRDEKLTDFKPVKNPIGVYTKEVPFSQHEIELQKGDQIYMSTDGYIDQFGGEFHRKFMSRKLKGEILSSSTSPMPMQKSYLNEVFSDWKKDTYQLDDCTLIGVKI